MGFSPRAIAGSVGSFFHVPGKHALPESVTAVAIKTTVWGIPHDQADVAVLHAAGALPDTASGGKDITKIISEAPKDGAVDFINGIKDAAKSALHGIVLDWKDKHFPNKLDMVLEKQRAAEATLTNLVITKRVAIRAAERNETMLTGIVADLTQQYNAAPDGAQKNALLAQKSAAEGNLATYKEQVRLLKETTKEFEDKLQGLTNKVKMDEANAVILKQRHSERMALGDLDKKLQEAHDSMTSITGDIARLNAQVAEREATSLAKLAELNNRIIPISTGPQIPGGTTGAVAATPTPPTSTPPAA